MNTKARGVLIGVLYCCMYFLLMYYRTFLKMHSPFIVVYFLNTMPNFLAGFVLTIFLFKIFIKTSLKIKFVAPFIITSFYLTFEEYYPFFSHNIFFDINDIIMSWIGALLGTITIFKIEKK